MYLKQHYGGFMPDDGRRKKGLREGKAEGLKEGEAKGKLETAKIIAAKLLKKGQTIEDIMDSTGLSQTEIEAILNSNIL